MEKLDDIGKSGIDQVIDLGFSSSLVDALRLRMEQGCRRFFLPDKHAFDAGILRCVLEFRLDSQVKSVSLVQYEAMLQRDLVIEHRQVGQLDTRQLEKQLQEISWNGPAFTRGNMLQYGRLDAELEQRLAAIFAALEILASAGQEGLAISEQLQLTYWYDTRFNRHYIDSGNLDTLSRKYYPSRIFTAQPLVPVEKAYELMAPRRHGVSAMAKRKAGIPRKLSASGKGEEAHFKKL